MRFRRFSKYLIVIDTQSVLYITMSKNARKILLSAKDSFYIIFLKYFDYLFRAKGIHRS